MNPTARHGLIPIPGKLLLLAGIAGSVILFYQFNLTRFFELEYLVAQRMALNEYYISSPYKTACVFFLVYVLLTGLSLPVAAIMMVASGVIFGLLWGSVIASFASAAGATVAFLSSRYLLRDFVLARFADKLALVNSEFEKDGIYYLLFLRQTPLIPSFLINIVMGLTPVNVGAFYLTSQIGMLAGTLVFVNAGTQIAAVNTLSDILSVKLIGAFVLVGILPLVIRKILLHVKNRRNTGNNHAP